MIVAAPSSPAGAYSFLVDSDPQVRAETVPAALANLGAPVAGGALSSVQGQAISAIASGYATSAYQLQIGNGSAVLASAKSQLGVPYVWGGETAGEGFDCSGLVQWAFDQEGYVLPDGSPMPRTSQAQWDATRQWQVPLDQLQPGDLVFFVGGGDGGSMTAPGHVGIYAGNGQIIDAPYTGTVVRYDNMTDAAQMTQIVGATRPPTTSTSGTSTASSATSLTAYQSFAQAVSDASFGQGQFSYLDLLWNRESGWNPNAVNPTSGADGIPQALPASKMASAGPDWATDGYTQIIWGVGYIQAVYGSPQAAWAHEEAFGWY
jgi:cell wall-associated NlpC family hydrolase